MANVRHELLIVDLHPESILGGAESILRGLANYAFVKCGYSVIWLGASFQFYRGLQIVYRLLGLRASPYTTAHAALAEGVFVERLTLATLIPGTGPWKRARAWFREADRIYAKNEFLEVLLVRYLGGRAALRKTIVGMLTALQVPDPVTGTWRRVHDRLYLSGIYRSSLRATRGCHGLGKGVFGDLGFLGVTGEHVRVLGCPVWTGSVAAAPRSQQFCAAFAGRLTAQKGVDLLLDVARQLCESGVRISIAGAGDMEESVRDAALHYANVEYVGVVSDVAALFSAAGVVLMPSRFETFGMTCAEALAVGTPVVAFDVPGPDEILSCAGLQQLLIPPFDTHAMAEKVLELRSMWEDHPRRYREGFSAAGKRIRELFDPEAVFRRVLSSWDDRPRGSRLSDAAVSRR